MTSQALQGGFNSDVAKELQTDLGMSLDSKSADKELKAVTPEKSKSCITTFTKKIGNSLPAVKNQRWSYFPRNLFT